ncbi:hypothetical protein Smp_097680 [Schistosoma mansoni]|uniref:hypothetical protein n=1 Tax=Schistosoma mansoni TaxID=6183 RepID=UPI00022C87BF|nr:hypothetical protein Smp_097680 [Schistosoma mansoni]|eukprot:XP_018645907.1 hypothetical protein Smp_097680 [Schistosoma mansoni]
MQTDHRNITGHHRDLDSRYRTVQKSPANLLVSPEFGCQLNQAQSAIGLAETDSRGYGERLTPLQLATTKERCLNSHLFDSRDRNSGLKVLVDTGADLNIIPLNKTELGRETSPVILQADNKTKITAFHRIR